ncbi:glycosyltransferase family 2 protein [Anaeroarcus burkinensis]|uniref:glycosyltransferase family 2 protein n=1 Tax=Anaeroarcus burkinensis TaxID=82376 RepID=UPI0004036FBE|nr:glycosyltransferase family A protein [Anaeroarcus burkinensis]
MSEVVTVCILSYNNVHTIVDAIESILHQSYRNLEILLIDDGSTDGTLDILFDFAKLDKRVAVISDGKNRGISYRLNQAVQLSQGRYFARMDGDDISFPSRLEKQLLYINRHPDIDVVGTGLVTFKSNGELTGAFPLFEKHEKIIARIWSGVYLAHATWFGKKEWFMRFPYRSSYDGAEDQDILRRAYKTSRFAAIDEVLYAYRQDGASFNKRMRVRSAFLRSRMNIAIEEHNYVELAGVVFLQSLKILVDIMGYVLGDLDKFMFQKRGEINADVYVWWNSYWCSIKKET